MSPSILFALSMLGLMLASGLTYQFSCEESWFTKPVRLAFKGLTTLLAALLALYAYGESGQTYALLMVLGLVLCAVADVLLELHFLSGTACFALAHGVYVASFWMRKGPGWPSLVLYLCLALALSLAALWIHRTKKMQVLPFYLYALVISAMLALALAQPIWVLLGAVLFAVSDGLIARRMIFPDKDPLDRAVIGLYYLAQYILAASLLF